MRGRSGRTLLAPVHSAPAAGLAEHRPRRIHRELKAAGIGTSVHFIPLHQHPYYIEQYGYRQGDFPQAEDSFSRCISLADLP